MWRVRDEPQSVGREPIPAVATPPMGDRRELTETRAACEAPDVEPGQGNELLAMGVRVASADGSQQSRGRGRADARQL
jgi:hypothetical protein